MKKHLLNIVAAVLAVCLFVACSSVSDKTDNNEGKLQIVTTIFPEYDWVKNVLGTNPANVDVTLLLDKGVDLHSYQPTAEDIIKIADSDIFIYVGGESDEWVGDVLKEANNPDMVVINLLEVLGDNAKEEEIIEGMEGEEEECEDEEEEEEGPEYDEYVWLSLKNAVIFTDAISEAIQKKDPANAGVYSDNAAAYKEKLIDLDQRYSDTVAECDCNTLIFGDRFPFRYMTDDYNLTYYAAFIGCSSETEASFETIVFLAKKADELSVRSIITIEGSDGKIAETIVQNTTSKDQKILTLDSMQCVTSEDIKNGESYYGIMENNLKVLKEALSNEDKVSDAVDVDLTGLSAMLVYSEVYNMVYEPEDYIGKTVKMKGEFAEYYDEQSGNYYSACIIKDAMACCAQGMEFVLTDDYVYPDDYPSEGDEITVVGVFDTYMEGKDQYCTLRDARLV